MQDKFKSVREQIAAYSPYGILSFCFGKSFELANQNVQQYGGYLPWNILLLAKWSLAYGDPENTRYPTLLEVNAILNEINDLSSENKFLNRRSAEGLRKFARQMAFQQFWLQERISRASVARQIELFEVMGAPLRSQFESLSGLSTLEFFELSTMLWTKFYANDRKYFFYRTWFVPVVDRYGWEKIDRFLSLLSINYKDAALIAKQNCERRPIELQVFEQSPFKSYPLFLDHENGAFFAFSPTMIGAALEFFIYDYLKKIDSSDFGTKFGPIFEKYVQKVLVEGSIPYVSEVDIKKRIVQNNVIDFILPSDQGTVFIEVKAMEMAELAQLNPETQIMANTVRSNVVKGVYQVNKVSEDVVGFPEKWPELNSNNRFALIVSYKDLYIGSGSDPWDEFIRDSLAREHNFYLQHQTHIAPENIFFLSITDFENLVLVSAGSIDKMISILKTASEANRKPELAKYVFSMHLESYRDVIQPGFPFLNRNFESLFSRVLGIPGLRKG